MPGLMASDGGVAVRIAGRCGYERWGRMAWSGRRVRLRRMIYMFRHVRRLKQPSRPDRVGKNCKNVVL